MRLAWDLQQTQQGILPGSRCHSSGEHWAHLAFHIKLVLPPALHFYRKTALGEDGGRRANNLSQLLSPYCEYSSALLRYFILFNCRGFLLKLFLQTFNYCTFFTTIGFICPRNCLQQFKMSKFGAGLRSVNTNPKLVQKKLL